MSSLSTGKTKKCSGCRKNQIPDYCTICELCAEEEKKMSLLKQSDYIKESKKNNIVSPRRASHGGISTSTKVRLPSQHKSLNHKCSQCNRTDAKKYSISEREVRYLCPICLNKNQRKNIKEVPHFVRASRLRIK